MSSDSDEAADIVEDRPRHMNPQEATRRPVAARPIMFGPQPPGPALVRHDCCGRKSRTRSGGTTEGDDQADVELAALVNRDSRAVMQAGPGCCWTALPFVGGPVLSLR